MINTFISSFEEYFCSFEKSCTRLVHNSASLKYYILITRQLQALKTKYIQTDVDYIECFDSEDAIKSTLL